ncbi:matrixin family metalloprotease (plasmid) [Haladaptatus sp. SPP-AMP-3]|uniref:matrixin family metalloprotease n=1 Tax=Haladaptatus sp. SPP-AMP-3 TaxID=3121295 RepID=UPI003C2C1C58
MKNNAMTLILVLTVLLAGCGGQLTKKTSTTEISTATTDRTTAMTETMTTTPPEKSTSVSSSETTTTVQYDYDTEPVNPWREENISVAINNSVNDRNFRPLVRDALDYWEENDSEYGDYEVNYSLKNNATAPDIEVRIVSKLSMCGLTYYLDDDLLGCASILHANSDPDDTEIVRIKAGYTNESTLRTIKHEFGHTHGLSHEDQPKPLMNETFDSTHLPMKNARDRDIPWKSSNLKVYVDYSNVREYDRDDYRDQVNHALTYYSKGAEGSVSSLIQFQMVSSKSDANIVIDFPDSPPCADENDDVSCNSIRGISLDEDPELEYLTSQHISVSGIDEDAIGWHIGYWLADSLVNNKHDIPPVFEDADYDDRRNWY